jgi:hypothetical protein
VPLSNFVPRGLGFVYHSIAILYRAVPNLSITIRNFFVAVLQRRTGRARRSASRGSRSSTWRTTRSPRGRRWRDWASCPRSRASCSPTTSCRRWTCPSPAHSVRLTLRLRLPARVESSRALLPHRPREDGLARPADTTKNQSCFARLLGSLARSSSPVCKSTHTHIPHTESNGPLVAKDARPLALPPTFRHFASTVVRSGRIRLRCVPVLYPNSVPAGACAGTLQVLTLGGNRLASWAAVDTLDHFPSLADVRLTGNPLQDSIARYSPRPLPGAKGQ